MNLRHISPVRGADFSVALAQSADDIAAAMRLRYRVFVQELGAQSATIDHTAAIERDRFDPHAKHVLLRDLNLPVDQQVVGAYRLLDQAGADAIGGFYTEAEFDISALKSSGKRLLELGRSCIAPDYRGSAALLHLWQGVGRYVAAHQIDCLFGVASFQGTNPADHDAPLALLKTEHLADPDIRPYAVGQNAAPIMSDANAIDRKAAMRAMPPLIKSYLRMGGKVGPDVFIDHDFNTVDVCMIVDIAGLSPRQHSLYGQPTP